MKKCLFSLSILAYVLSYSQTQTWNTTGNAGTNSATDFIGTTDDQPLVFKTNGVEKIKLSPSGRLVFYNTNSQTWNYNLYIGGGNENPSESPVMNYANVAVGLGSMISNTTGSSNTALGYNTMTNNTKGSINTALGINAMQSAVDGNNNVAVGVNTLGGMITGDYNTAVGNSALRSWGSVASLALTKNTAIGSTALMRLNNGGYNTVVGQDSFVNTYIGSNNIALGSNNARDANNATGNIYIGNNIIPFNTQPTNELNIGNWIIGNNGIIGIGQFSYRLPADGVGPDGQKYKLFVRDGIKTEKVKVDIASANGWADYVFKKGYQLMPLSEVEKHIQDKGHLPNIPSADEVVKNGIDLGAMDAKLLGKIEELTLYSIEQDKKLQAEEEKNKKQQILIERLIHRIELLENKK
ncbi:hypothetical protein [Chryseobacterium jejuense]|uniref:hypothetical protein n=1 Tax=Chryseobacterium jejuense TaxID=445960 RepID=UPI001AE1198E|nr:hypothetical protein [Chryseobacterium jejuense]MBP2619249.1 hypothetical protein [Chryseobacterium jejuense]